MNVDYKTSALIITLSFNAYEDIDYLSILLELTSFSFVLGDNVCYLGGQIAQSKSLYFEVLICYFFSLQMTDFEIFQE